MPYAKTKDIVRIFAKNMQMSQWEAKKYVDEFIRIEAELITNGGLEIHEFGKFTIKEMPEKYWVNPNTKEGTTVPAKKKVVFKPSKVLNERL